jgi:tetratricopeptide (TPR) repeat protein
LTTPAAGKRHARSAPPPRGFRSLASTLWAGLAILALVFVAYQPVRRAGFIWDDDAYVQDNPLLRSGAGLRQIWLKPRASPQYYPLVFTSFWLEYQLWKLNPVGYHLTNLLLHGGAAVLLWRLLRRLELRGAWLAAALFALHPVQVESVAWITERKNVLCGVFYFGAALAYLHYALPRPLTAAGRHHPAAWYSVALVLFVLALFSKTVAATLPAALFVVLWWRRGRPEWKDAALVPMAALGLCFGLLTIWLEKHHVGAAGPEWELTLPQRLIIAGRAVCFYVGKVLWPADLAFIYPRWQIDPKNPTLYLYPAAVLLTLVSLYLLRRRFGTGPLAAAFCYIGTLFPALGFFNVYPMRYSFVADHFQYLATPSALAAMTALVAGLLRQRLRRPAVAWLAAGAVLTVAGVLTCRQARIYSNLETLWRDTLRKNPTAWMAHNNLANLLRDAGRLDEAADHYLQALAVKPDFAMAASNLGIVRKLQGRLDEAAACYEQAIRLDPDYAPALYNLGNLRRDQGRWDEAIAAFCRAIELKPNYAFAHVNLGWMLLMRGQLDQAEAHLRQALQARPDLPEAHLNLGLILQARGRLQAAIEAYQEALRLDPQLSAARHALEQARRLGPP